MQISKRADKISLNDKVIQPDGSLAHISMIEYSDNGVCLRFFDTSKQPLKEGRIFLNKFDHVNILVGN